MFHWFRWFLLLVTNRQMQTLASLGLSLAVKPHPKHQVSVRVRTVKAGLAGISQGVLTTTSAYLQIKNNWRVIFLHLFCHQLSPKFLSSPQAAAGGSSVRSESTTENIHPYAEVWEPVLSLKKITESCWISSETMLSPVWLTSHWKVVKGTDNYPRDLFWEAIFLIAMF